MRFPGTMLVATTSVMGQDYFITIATPLAFEVQELKYILCLELFWQSFSASCDVLVSCSRKMFDLELLILL